jgi:hypothetical protein
VKQNHFGDQRGFAQMEGLFSAISGGDMAAINNLAGTKLQGYADMFKRKKNAKTDVSDPNPQSNDAEIKAFIQNFKKSQHDTVEKQTIIDSVYTFLEKGETTSAKRLLADHTTLEVETSEPDEKALESASFSVTELEEICKRMFTECFKEILEDDALSFAKDDEDKEDYKDKKSKKSRKHAEDDKDDDDDDDERKERKSKKSRKHAEDDEDDDRDMKEERINKKHRKTKKSEDEMGCS